MADVARAAGCSQATVSLVLNDVREIAISSELRARVIQTAKDLGYGQANQIRRSLLEQMRGRSLGFIVDQLATTPEAINAIEGARQATWDQDVTLLVAQTLGRPEREESVIETLLAAGASGIVFMTIFTRQVKLNPIFHQLTVPVALLNCYASDSDYPAVIPDETTGGYDATTVLIQAGHTRIATITGEAFMEATDARLSGYKNALARAGISLSASYIVAGNWTPSSGYDATRKLMSLKQPPSAIFCQNDKMAIGCLNALLDIGLRVPDDVSIIGYDDDEICRQIRPQLTSVDLPHRSMGALAVESLASRGTRGRQNLVKVSCAVVNRASVQRHGGG